MNIYIYIYIAFPSAVRQIYINYLPKAFAAPILASKKTSSDYIAYKNIILTFSWLFSLGSLHAWVGKLGAENNCYLSHYYIVSCHYIIVAYYTTT